MNFVKNYGILYLQLTVKNSLPTLGHTMSKSVALIQLSLCWWTVGCKIGGHAFMVRGFGYALFLISGTFRNYNYWKNETLKDLNFAKNCGILVMQTYYE